MSPQVPPLIERDAERDALLTALADPPRLAAVEGEAGIGRTRLVREATADSTASGRQLLVGLAPPRGQRCPFVPVVEALATAGLPGVRRLSPLTGALRAVLPERADLLPPAPPPLEDVLLARHRLLRAAADLLGAMGPAVLVLEDLHWADDMTIELLGLLSARPPPELSLVVTYRAEELAAAAPLTGVLAGCPEIVGIRLSPLSVRGTARLAAAVLGDPSGRVPDVAWSHLPVRHL